MDVLVVEDDAATRKALTKILLREGYLVAEVEDGLAALSAVEARRFDAIVCDLRLPYLPGGGFYEQLAKRDPEMARRVIFVSAIAHDPAVRKFLDSTGRPYFAKPFDIEALVAAVRQVAA